MPTGARPSPGDDLGPYRVVAEVGGGGMGTVYRAEVVGRVPGLDPGDLVALKVVHPHLLKTSGFFKRFLREGEVGKRIRHPNVVATYDLDGLTVNDEPVLYIAMEYVEGQTLWSLYRELGAVPEDLARHLGLEVAKGLRAIHEQGVVHRDLKPENILVTTAHEVKIMDLGVARPTDESARLSDPGTFIGSALYAAPEQFAEKGVGVDRRADLYALGLVLYELVSGKHPHDADDVPNIMRRVVSEAPQALSELAPHVSAFFEEVVHTLLEKDREKRFGSAGLLHDVLFEGEKSEWWKLRLKGSRAGVRRAPKRVHVDRATALFGRGAEVARLEAVYARAKTGEGRVVLLEGEAGIGKTRLVDEFVAGLVERGEQVNFLFGQYPPAAGPGGGPGATSGAIVRACRGFFADGDLDAELRARLTETPLLVPAFAALLRGDTSPTGAERLTEDSIQTAMVHLLRSLASDRPTVLFVDDLHFASNRSLATFAAVALAAPGHRLMLVGASRPGMSDEWTSSIGRMGHAERMPVQRLGLKDLARMLIAAVGSERLADEIGFQLLLKSDGNPFFVFEILRGLRESGGLVAVPGGAWKLTRPVGELAVPSSLRDLVKARLAAVSEDERDVLEVAACAGFEFDPRLVSDAMGLERVVVLKRLARIERTHRVVHPVGDRFVFDHHEVHQAVYGGLPDPLRAEYHAALATALEKREGAAAADPSSMDGARVVELAELFLRSGAGDRAARYLAPALSHLDRMYAGDLAADLAARALAASGAPTGDARIEILLPQAERLGVLGRHAEERAAVDEALALAAPGGDARLRARALVGVARHCRHVARYDEVLPRLDEALALAAKCGSKDAEASARGILGDVLCELGRYDEARVNHEREIALLREIGDTGGEAVAQGKLGNVHFARGQFDEAYAHFLRDLGIGSPTQSRLAGAHMKLHMGDVLYALGRYDDARAHFDRCLALSRLVGFRRGEATALAHLGEVDLAMGDVDSAKRHLESALDLCRETGVRFVQGQALHALACVCAASGDPREAFAHAKSALALRKEIGDRAGLAATTLLLGRLRRAAGAVDAARTAFKDALALAEEMDLAGERVLAAAHLAQYDDGDVETAAKLFATHEKRLKVNDRMEARTLLWQKIGDPEHLVEAKQLLDLVLAHVPAESRAAAIERAPLLKRVSAA